MRQFRPSLRHHGLTEQQWRILRALAAVETIEVTELARTAFLLGPSLSRILRDLEARQLIERRVAEADQRRAVVSISADGLKLIEAVAPSSEAIYAAITKRYGARKLAELQEMLARAGTQPFRHGSGGGRRRGGGPVSANLHDATGAMHSGRANHRNRAPMSGGSHRHARDFSLKVAAKPVMKIGAGAGVAADDAAGPIQGRTKSAYGHHTSSEPDQLRCRSLRPFRILARRSQAHRDLSDDRQSHRP